MTAGQSSSREAQPPTTTARQLHPRESHRPPAATAGKTSPESRESRPPPKPSGQAPSKELQPQPTTSSLAEVNIDITNTGNGIITISFLDHNGNSIGPLVLRPNQIIRRKLQIDFPYFFTLSRGRDERTISHTFTKNETIDTNKCFV